MQNLNAKSAGVLARTLGEELLAKDKKVASVESCTGGGVAFAITEVAGSSQWFEKSWVTYSNQAKNEEVGVSVATLATFGAVSSEVVREMAEGGLHKSGADLCVSISGIAGPGGGTASKPVGLVWFAIAVMSRGVDPELVKKIDTLHSKNAANKPSNQIHTRCFSRCFSGDRQQVREQAINLALKELIISLVNM
ncbi:CinA family protein [Brumicola pallidula]|uniref:Protein ygaD n=1 Tax=Brumicola pallidula DSM 14239 = ACAM 615 TaxID=1121922 RepID=K6ZHL4_9ALTE|nr:nicotinamide-nucleotide amidohydrolase family protein [Glaciecola pallidula]GAC29827.1 protein ygaD [Glaciecola pallidula DSM 14239 = ACAM 615]